MMTPESFCATPYNEASAIVFALDHISNHGPAIMNHPIILFDGVCNLCRSSVQFVIRRDSKKRFRFAPLQSERGKELLAAYGLSDSGLESMILIYGDNAYRKSSAALHIAKKLDGLWPLMFAFAVIPSFIRHAVYDFIGNRRYRWFGKMSECWVPSADLKDRFLQ